ncbi:MAG: sulfate adenylyltransferase subunit CysN [Pirellulaceae bacterium]
MNTTTTMDSIDLAGKQLLTQHANKELLRFITCGSVDDGKSTLIGRLLLENGAVYEDQVNSLRKDSKKHGTTDLDVDPALLLDGLEDERQQGITIDVAYRYFTTPKRKFIIADTPGHEQFTRNMATGASTTDLAIILVDASKGILTQTRRHTFIVSLLGIKHVVLAVNKMDLVEYSQNVFESICDEFGQFASKLEIPDIRFVPLSALHGDNVIRNSSMTPWYEDGSLLHILENIYIGADGNHRDLRFPVQWVNRPDANFRGYSGTVSSGALQLGEEVMVLPSEKRSRISRIISCNGDLKSAHAGQAITIKLTDEIDISRGDMIVRPANRPFTRRNLDAMIVWMSDKPLQTGNSYWVKQTTKRTSGVVNGIRYKIDVNTLHRSSTTGLQLNDIGRCQLLLRDPIMFDAYRQNRETGSFILVDRITHETAAAGMLLSPRDGSDDFDGEVHPENELRLQRAISRIPENQRAQRYGHLPYTILITGLSGSGKTTLALELEQWLFEDGKKCVVLDGQTMRFGISRDLGFSAEERSENLLRAAEIAKLLNDSGLICIAAFAAPHDEIRQRVRNLIGADRFLHVHLTTPLAICRQRDSTGRYAAADKGTIANFPGVTAPYDPPQATDLEVSTESMLPDRVAEEVIRLLRIRSNLSRA